MASLQQIISWFKEGLFPTEDQFRQTWLSYWHKSEKIPQSQVFGLQNSLDTLSTGMIYKEPVQNLADLTTTYPNPVKGWSVQVINEKNADGNSLIYQWDGNQWNNTGMVGFPADTVKKSELEEVEEKLESSLVQLEAEMHDIESDFDGNTIVYAKKSDVLNAIVIVSDDTVFNPVSFEKGYGFINENGSINSATTSWEVSEYIQCKKEDTFEYTGNPPNSPIPSVYLYDDNKSPIQILSSGISVIIFSIPQNGYIRISGSTGSISLKKQGLESSTLKEYIDKGSITVVHAEEGDVLNAKTYIQTNKDELKFNTAFGIINENGSINSATTSWVVTELIQCEVGDIFEYTGGPANVGLPISYLYNEDNTPNKVLAISTGTGMTTVEFITDKKGFIRAMGSANKGIVLKLTGKQEVSLRDYIDLKGGNIEFKTRYFGYFWVLWGDSLTSAMEDYAHGTSKYISEKLGMTYDNRGVSGFCITGMSAGSSFLPRILAYDFTNVEITTISTGTNDFKLNKEIGSIGSIFDDYDILDTNTFYGSFRKAIEYIISSNSKCEIVLTTPFHRSNSGATIESTNAAGYKLSDYVEAIKKLAELYSLKVIDCYNHVGINTKNLNIYTTDGLHLNDEGYQMWNRLMLLELAGIA